MTKTQPRVLPEHFRSRIPHHDFDLVTTISLITMHWAFGARWLFITKTASFQTQADVSHQFVAFLTEGATVMVMTIYIEHRCNGLPLTGQPTIREFLRY